MFDFGEEVTIESYRIPWLIWIQLLVLFLLIFLLYCFSISALDLSPTTTTTTTSPPEPSSSSSSSSILKHNTTLTTSCLQVGGSQSIKGEIATSTSRRIVREESSSERDSSTKDAATPMNFHLCHIMRAARQAFLKCLGLDSSQDNSPTPEQIKKQ